MVSKKYVNDYKLDVEYNPLTKRQKTTAHYIGPRYGFSDPESVRGTKILFTALTLVIVAVHILMLFLNAPCMHVWYVNGAPVFLMLPCLFLLAALWRLLTAKEGITREHKEKTEVRFPTALLFTMILSVLGLAGHLVYSIRVGDVPADRKFYVFLAVILASSAVLFSARRRISFVETDPGTGDKADNIKKEEELKE